MDILASPKQKRLAIFLDGTWNEEGDNTSVWRLRSLCAPFDTNQKQQLIYYHTGLGTTFGEKIRGGLYGFGIDENVKKAYEWVVENYDESDEIFIFGFSRGAFTARCLAGLISICGIVKPGSPLGVGQLYARYGTVDRNHESIRRLFQNQKDGVLANPTREQHWLLKYSRQAEITMLGVWDTVAAIDWPGATKHQFLDPNLRHDMKNAFHALALDEHRERFSPTLWTNSSPKVEGPPKSTRELSSVEQRWFIGAHANVGGGYAGDLLPQLPLRWIKDKAVGLGLAFRNEVDVEDKAFCDPVVDSFGPFLLGLYKQLTAPHYRPVGQAVEERDGYLIKTINETIDGSVFERWREDKDYRPQNLIEWANRYSVDPTVLSGPVKTDAPNISA